jgi:hypothetical protein
MEWSFSGLHGNGVEITDTNMANMANIEEKLNKRNLSSRSQTIESKTNTRINEFYR